MGENGTGKSSLLQAFALLMVGSDALSEDEIENAEYTISLFDLNQSALKRKRFRELNKLLISIDLGASIEDITSLYLDTESEFLGMDTYVVMEKGLVMS